MAVRGVYVGGSLADLFTNAAQEATRRAARSIVRDAGMYLHERAVEHTPIESGATRASWTVSTDERGKELSARVSNNHFTAAWLEFGTKPHTEEPEAKQADSWINPLTGRRVFARSVHHPGAHAFHTASRAALDLEVYLPMITRPALDGWKQAIEDIARAHPGIS